MILTVAASFTLLGFIAWILGTIFDYTGVAVIGGTLIVGVGFMASAEGVEHQVGEIETTNENNETVTQAQYDTIDTPATLPVGWLVMLLGGVMVLRALNEAGSGGG